MSAEKSQEVRPRRILGQRIDQVFALLWIVVGLVVFIQSRDLQYLAEYGPGPGFLPFWSGVILIILGFMLLARVTFSRKEKEAFTPPSKHAAWQMFLVMAGFFVFVFFAETIGFLLGIGLLFLFLLVVVERKGWRISLAIAIINTMVFWVIFELGLQLRLPAGLLDLLK
jgi:putative tricarboxylic transport membrane protein